MRILVLSNLYPNPTQPHRAPFVRHQVRILAERHAVRVIAPIAWTDELRARRAGTWTLGNRRRLHDGVEVVHPRYWFIPKLLRGRTGHFYRASIRRMFNQEVAAFQPDILYVQWVYPDGWAGVQLAKPFHFPVVLKSHGSDVLFLDHYPAKRQRTEEALRSADGVLCVSENLADHIRRAGATNVHVVYDGVDPTVFHPGNRLEACRSLGIDPEWKHLLFVGNLVDVKNVPILLEAFARLKHDRTRLHVIGQGPLRASLEARTRTLGIDDRVTFHGSMGQQSLVWWYRAATVLALPSKSEGVPNVLLEAMACDLPWVASAVGGVPEVLHRGAGKLVPVGDVQSLADALGESLTQSQRASNPAPRTRIEAVAEVERFLEEVVRARRS